MSKGDVALNVMDHHDDHDDHHDERYAPHKSSLLGRGSVRRTHSMSEIIKNLPKDIVSASATYSGAAASAIARVPGQLASSTSNMQLPLHRQVMYPPNEEEIKLAVEKEAQYQASVQREKSEKGSLEDAMKEVDATEDGLTASQVASRTQQYGKNKIPEKKRYPILEFLYFMWNPLSWTMEIAALISIILIDYIDFLLIIALLLINASIGFYEESSAGTAVNALKSQLQPTARVLRDGAWGSVPAEDLVPGDVIALKIGNVIPADCRLFEAEAVKVDQSALTGESLPVNKNVGDEVYSGATMKQGEATGLVCKTGINTFFGRAANLMAQVENSSHLQSVLRKISLFCITFIVIWAVVELIVEFGVRKQPCIGVGQGQCNALSNMLVLLVGGIPIAMPTVLSVTMAIGATQLAKKEAIVSRLTAVEELAGMDILCSDKTGTLTLNVLTVDTPLGFEGASEDDIMLDACLSSAIDEDKDAIDTCILNYYEKNHSIEERRRYTITKHYPFNPVDKKAMGLVKDEKTGETFKAAKGAPQVILNESYNKATVQEQVEAKINEFAQRGYRTLGVSRSVDPEFKKWKFEGLIPLFDPPRHDTEETIKRAISMGVRVKMITGDQLAIAKETARRLGMTQNLYTIPALKENDMGISKSDLIEQADGFAEMWPEHKYEVVQSLQKRKHIVGMTGDGVNDAPALKKADIGIAVAGATDAARSVSDIVLVSPGLSVIIDAIIASRKIFQRMRNYVIYSVSATIRICLTFAILTIAFQFYFPTIATIVIAILNDGTMLTISKDRVEPRQTPDSWNLVEVFSMAAAFGLYLTVSSIVLYILVTDGRASHIFGLPILTQDQVRGMIYLQVSGSGLATIFVSRSQGFSWMERPGALMSIAFVLSQIAATFIGVYGFNGYPNDGRANFDGCGWGYALLVWVWVLIWFIPMDFIKFFIMNIIMGKIGVMKSNHPIHDKLHFFPRHHKTPRNVQ